MCPNNIYNGSDIEVTGRGVSSTMPDQVTIVFNYNLNAANSQEMLEKITKQRDNFMQDLKSWAAEDDKIETLSYVVGNDSVTAYPLARQQLRITSKRLDKISELLKMGEKGRCVACMRPQFSLSETKQQDEKRKAIKKAIDDADSIIKATIAELHAKVVHVNNIKISCMDSLEKTPCISTFSFENNDSDLIMDLVETTVEVIISYQIGEE